MVRIEKLYFDLEEISQRWRIRTHDLAYMAENDELKVSVRLYTVRLEEGSTRPIRATANRIGSRLISRGSADCRT